MTPREPDSDCPDKDAHQHSDSPDCECRACCDKWLAETAEAFRRVKPVAPSDLLPRVLAALEWIPPDTRTNEINALAAELRQYIAALGAG